MRSLNPHPQIQMTAVSCDETGSILDVLELRTELWVCLQLSMMLMLTSFNINSAV